MEEKGKRAIVTGGSRGIGRAICLAFARQGMAVAINYVGNQEAAERTVEACLQLGAADAFAKKGDIAREMEAGALVEAAAARFGGVDILINNAGVTRDNLLMRLSAADLDTVLDTNLKGAFHCMRAACRFMIKQRYGRIINLSSIVGIRGNAGQANYAASKAGLIGMTKSIAKELAGRGITANCVAPGFIETDMTAKLTETVREKLLSQIPVARLGQAEEVAAAVAFLASGQAGYITGQVLCIDGGMAM
ncbi:MAG: 3-oxoacyl-[acyl-carrier-protein] reductase [Clostridia bacterium]|nr:3-oxoacyl-[acyl-carrier-protein] reductase [Clostridia bacterium]